MIFGKNRRIRGAGSDSGSGSRTKADAAFDVAADPLGSGSRVSLMVEYNLQGPLAQFSRSGLVQEVGRQLVGEFARNLNKSLTASSGSSGPLDVRGLFFAAFNDWLKRIFGRRVERS